MKCYWWLGNAKTKNFGDELSRLILAHFCQTNVQWSSPADAEIVSTGSVLDVLPRQGWGGIVAGSGKLHVGTHTDLTSATVYGLRGHLTSQDMRLKASDRVNLVYGDPGLLVSELVPVERGKYELGVVPHWTDTELFEKELAASRRYKYAEPRLIDATGDPFQVIAEIGSCKKIIASSLHGIIAADSFGIPRRAEMFLKMSSVHEGGVFKFLDYASVLEQSIQFGTLQTAPMNRVTAIQAELFDMFNEIDRSIHA